MDYHLRLLTLEDDLLRTGRAAEAQIKPATLAMLEGNHRGAETVVSHDDEIDLAVHQVVEEVHGLLLTQSPLAGDLRLLLGATYAARSIQRVGDYALNIARLAINVIPDDEDQDLREQLLELSIAAERAFRTGLDSFGHRDPDGLASIGEIEDSVDRLSDGLIRRLVAYASSGPAQSAWAIQMIQAAKHMERIGDHAVAIAEQGTYVATGRRRLPRQMR